MSNRLFEKPDHAKVYFDARPTPPSALMDYILAFLQNKYKGELRCALDLGCGSGQSTAPLADLNKFEKVIGTDISDAQIETATQNFAHRESMHFLVSLSEKMPVADESVQLIISCAAAHWFDLSKVYEEGRRVLCENGVMAFMCYEFPRYEWNGPNGSVLDKAIQTTFDSINEYWASGYRIAYNKYESLIIPYKDFTRAEGFVTEKQVKISDITGFFQSMSAFQTLCDTEGEEAGEKIIKRLHTVLYENNGDKIVTQKFPYFVILARK